LMGPDRGVEKKRQGRQRKDMLRHRLAVGRKWKAQKKRGGLEM